MSDTIRVKIDDNPAMTVSRVAYVEAKTKQLREFGYTTLTKDHVNEQVDAVLSKKEFGDGLTVIGMLMKDEILPD